MTPPVLSMANARSSIVSWTSIVLATFIAAQFLRSGMEVAAFQAHIPEVTPMARLSVHQQSDFKKIVLASRKHGSSRSRWSMKPFAMSTVTDDATTETDKSGAEMDDSQLGAWVPLHSVSALKDIQPSKVTVMNIDFVVWYDNIQELWCAASDVCPHRLAPLSQGRVDEKTGCIECPYHGWEFHGNGTCAEIPQWSGTPAEFQKATADPKSPFHATGHPVHVIGDLMFVWLPTSVHGESFPKSVLPEDMYQGLAEQAEKQCKYYVRELPYSFDLLVENFMDPAHIPFAHHSLQAVREDGVDIPMKVLVNNFTNIEVGYQDLNKNKTNDRVVSFQRPNYYHFRTKDQTTGEYKKSLQIYCIPVRAGQCRAIFQTISIGFIPDWLSHAGSNRFLNTDTWLHNTERVLKSPELSGKSATDESAYVMASTSDTGVKAFRSVSAWLTAALSVFVLRSFVFTDCFLHSGLCATPHYPRHYSGGSKMDLQMLRHIPLGLPPRNSWKPCGRYLLREESR
jgi:phenylpropionate dioxygenase-like ring-hydroxylating dioxygenase large terminal subunit